MSEIALRRRITPATSRRSRQQSSSRRGTPASRRRSSRPIEILKRSSSDPALSTFAGHRASPGEDNRNLSAGENFLYWPHTCTDIFSPGESFAVISPGKFEGYKKDAKVVVNVIVEGSPGPVRTTVKLGANVEETIRLVISKYSEEGRTPLLDKDAASNFQLHHSHFSLASLNRSDVIGDAGTRSFYLCRGSNSRSNSFGNIISTSFTSNTPPRPDPSPFLFLSSFLSHTISKMTRRTRKLWRIFGCLQCN